MHEMRRVKADPVNTAPLPLHPGAKEHYAHAAHYEARYAERTEDVAFYRRRISASSSVLEYGAGAGRLTLPLVEKGASVCAVDASPSMVALLRERLRCSPAALRSRASVHQADMRSFRSKKRFDFVVAAFHTLCHLYSVQDMASFLSHAFTHLKPGGRILFDLPFPRIDMPEYDPIAGVRVTEMDGPSGAQLLTQRWYQPQEVALHLHYAGFHRIRLTSDFTREAIDAETSVFVASAMRPAC